MTVPRTIEQIVEDRSTRWRTPAATRSEVAWRPAVALSRLPGAGGERIARRLAEDLGYEVFDRQIVHHIATGAHLADRAVEFLDERDRPALTDLLAAIG